MRAAAARRLIPSAGARSNHEGEAILVDRGGPSLSSLGRVAFTAELDDFDEGLFVGAPLRTIASSTGEFAFFDGRPALNDLGLVGRGGNGEGRVSPPLASLTGLAAVYWSAQ